MADQSGEKIFKIGKIDSSISNMERWEQYKLPPDQEQFGRLMSQPVEQKVEIDRLEQEQKPSPIEEIQLSQRVEKEPASLNRLLAQAQSAIDKIDSVKQDLTTPKLEIKHSVQSALRNKLTHIDESLKVALSKVGVDYVPPEKPAGLVGPMQNFINYLTHGQSQLESLTNEVTKMQEKKDQMSASSLLTLQLKVGFIQQELELFSSLLNKSLESIKTLMNVQV